MNGKTPVQILKDGLAYLRENGWRRHQFGYMAPGDKCSACVMGAVYAGTEVEVFNTDHPELGVALNMLKDELPEVDLARGLVYYNDRIAKRRRDVERLFVRAIKKAEAAG